MTPVEKLKRNADTVLDSIEMDWQDTANAHTSEERKDLRIHLKWCMDGLRVLIAKLDKAEKESSGAPV